MLGVFGNTSGTYSWVVQDYLKVPGGNAYMDIGISPPLLFWGEITSTTPLIYPVIAYKDATLRKDVCSYE